MPHDWSAEDLPPPFDGETLERRDLRQWSLEQAVALFAGTDATGDETCALAERFLAWVTEEPPPCQ